MGRRRIISFEIDESMRGNGEVENLYVEKGMFLRIEERRNLARVQRNGKEK